MSKQANDDLDSSSVCLGCAHFTPTCPPHCPDSRFIQKPAPCKVINASIFSKHVCYLLSCIAVFLSIDPFTGRERKIFSVRHMCWRLQVVHRNNRPCPKQATPTSKQIGFLFPKSGKSRAQTYVVTPLSCGVKIAFFREEAGKAYIRLYQGTLNSP